MLRSGKSAHHTAAPARSRDIYQRYATGLYRQALLTLGDSALAEHAVRDVIVDECALAPVPGCGEGDTRCRLAESVFRRCQQLATEPAPARLPSRPAASRGHGRLRRPRRPPER